MVTPGRHHAPVARQHPSTAAASSAHLPTHPPGRGSWARPPCAPPAAGPPPGPTARGQPGRRQTQTSGYRSARPRAQSCSVGRVLKKREVGSAGARSWPSGASAQLGAGPHLRAWLWQPPAAPERHRPCAASSHAQQVVELPVKVANHRHLCAWRRGHLRGARKGRVLGGAHGRGLRRGGLRPAGTPG